MSLTDPLPELSPLQRRGVWILTIVIAMARAVSMAASPWDWDEMQFLLALGDYDVLFHRPHPPGFPLYIGAGKLLQLFGLSDFRALQALNGLAGAAMFPVALLTFREMRFPIRTAGVASAMLVFFPNVWFFGGTVFSDVPSLVLALAAVALLLRGCRSEGAYVAGAVVLAVAAGIRPQNLLIGALPALIATWSLLRRRRWPAVIAGALAAVAVLVAAYGVAASITGWGRYIDAVQMHRDFITTFDTGRVSLLASFADFFVRPYRAPVINGAVALLASIGLGRALLLRRVPLLVALGTFGPFAVAAWRFLDPLSASRFSIGYAPLIAAAAAEGIAGIAAVARSDRARRVAEIAMATGLVAVMIVWTLPAVIHVRQHTSPPASAMRWVARHADPGTSLVYVHETVLPFGWYYLSSHNLRSVHDAYAPVIRMRDAYFVTEGDRPEAVTRFVWPRSRLWDLVRRRYFSVSVSPTSSRIEFGAGWHGLESDGLARWRWMGKRAVTRILTEKDSGRLHIRFDVPAELLTRSPQVTVRWNGEAIDRFNVVGRNLDRTYRLMGPGELVLETTEVMNLAREGRGADPRDLGLMVREIQWLPDAR